VRGSAAARASAGRLREQALRALLAAAFAGK